MIRLSSSFRRALRAASLLGLAVVAGASLPGGALAQPVYKDLERFDGAPPRAGARQSRVEAPGRPARRLTPGPGYVGSEWGLGKPSYWGIGSRPDWGYWGD